jgi:hypothetical protein
MGVPSPCSASDVAAIALTAPEAFHWRAALPLSPPYRCHDKSVNRIPDNFLPKTCGGLMMEGLRDWRTAGLGLEEKLSDGYPKTIGPPDWARGAQRRPGWATAALDDEKQHQKILRRKSLVTH